MLSSAWDPEQRELSRHKFGEAVTYVSRLPKEWVKDMVTAIAGVPCATLKALEKDFKGSVHRMLCRVTALELNSALTTPFQEAFRKECEDRASKIGKVIFKVTQKKDGAVGCIMWGAHGWYKLSPPIAADAEKKNHIYTHVELLDKFQAPFARVLQGDGGVGGARQLRLAVGLLEPPRRAQGQAQGCQRLQVQACGVVRGGSGVLGLGATPDEGPGDDRRCRRR